MYKSHANRERDSRERVCQWVKNLGTVPIILFSSKGVLHVTESEKAHRVR
jgi:hypothetical protein